MPNQNQFDRYRLQEWLTFISSELHKMFSPWLFHPEYGAQAADIAKQKIRERFDFLEMHLASHDYLVGQRFGIADAYCYTIVNWSKGRGIDLTSWPNLMRYQSRIGERQSVREALAAEGLQR